jgi:hypothetical protein
MTVLPAGVTTTTPLFTSSLTATQIVKRLGLNRRVG